MSKYPSCYALQKCFRKFDSAVADSLKLTCGHHQHHFLAQEESSDTFPLLIARGCSKCPDHPLTQVSHHSC